MAPPKGKSKTTLNPRDSTYLNPEAPVSIPGVTTRAPTTAPTPAANPRAPTPPLNQRAPTAPLNQRAPTAPTPAANQRAPTPALNQRAPTPAPTPAANPRAPTLLKRRAPTAPTSAANPGAPTSGVGPRASTSTPAANPTWSPLSDGINTKDPPETGLTEQQMNRRIDAALYGITKSSLPVFEKLCREKKD